jgi:hypothetical protein
MSEGFLLEKGRLVVVAPVSGIFLCFHLLIEQLGQGRFWATEEDAHGEEEASESAN